VASERPRAAGPPATAQIRVNASSAAGATGVGAMPRSRRGRLRKSGRQRPDQQQRRVGQAPRGRVHVAGVHQVDERVAQQEAVERGHQRRAGHRAQPQQRRPAGRGRAQRLQHGREARAKGLRAAGRPRSCRWRGQRSAARRARRRAPPPRRAWPSGRPRRGRARPPPPRQRPPGAGRRPRRPPGPGRRAAGSSSRPTRRPPAARLPAGRRSIRLRRRWTAAAAPPGRAHPPAAQPRAARARGRRRRPRARQHSPASPPAAAPRAAPPGRRAAARARGAGRRPRAPPPTRPPPAGRPALLPDRAPSPRGRRGAPGRRRPCPGRRGGDALQQRRQVGQLGLGGAQEARRVAKAPQRVLPGAHAGRPGAAAPRELLRRGAGVAHAPADLLLALERLRGAGRTLGRRPRSDTSSQAAARAWATLASVEAAGGAPAAASTALLGSLRPASPCLLDSCASVRAPAWCAGGSGWPGSAPSGIQLPLRGPAAGTTGTRLICFVLFEPARARARDLGPGLAFHSCARAPPRRLPAVALVGPGAAERAPCTVSRTRTARAAQPPCPALGRGPCGGAPRSQAPPAVRVTTWSASRPGRSGSGAPSPVIERRASTPHQPTGLAAALAAAQRADHAAREGPSARRAAGRSGTATSSASAGTSFLTATCSSPVSQGEPGSLMSVGRPRVAMSRCWASGTFTVQRLCHAALWSLACMRGSGGKSASQRARAELLPATHARRRAAGRGRRGRRGRARQAHYTNRCRLWCASRERCVQRLALTCCR